MTRPEAQVELAKIEAEKLKLKIEAKYNVPNFENDPTRKETNPKDAIGCNKIPLSLWPISASMYGAVALLDGMLKYGRSNFRSCGARASIYYDACNRHLNAWFEGEEDDPDSGLPHLAHALACLAVLVDSKEAGGLVDDRMFPSKYRETIDRLTPHVKRLKELHKDKNPKHYTIQDKENFR